MAKNFDLKELVENVTGQKSTPVSFVGTNPITEEQTIGNPIPNDRYPSVKKNPTDKRSQDGTKERIKMNLFCKSQHARCLRLLASYRRLGPGAVLDDALSVYFSRPEILTELTQALESELKERDKDRLALVSRFKNEE